MRPRNICSGEFEVDLVPSRIDFGNLIHAVGASGYLVADLGNGWRFGGSGFLLGFSHYS
jgi:hypothetical protein